MKEQPPNKGTLDLLIHSSSLTFKKGYTNCQIMAKAGPNCPLFGSSTVVHWGIHKPLK